MKVIVGLRFQEREPPHRLWETVRIIDPLHGFRHAWLRLAADHRKTLMLSCDALENGEIYQAAGFERFG